MIPTPRQLALLGLLLGLGLAASLWPTLAYLWWAGLFALLGALGVDALAVLRSPRVAVERTLPSSLPLGVWREVALGLHNPGRQPFAVEVMDHLPEGIEAEGLPQSVRLPAGGHARLSYRVRAVERGEARFERVQLRIASPLGLWRRDRRPAAPATVRVYPNFAAVAKYILLALDNRLSQMGILKRRRRGEGQDFHQLREYRAGDAPRQVDWKATARMRKLISREYQDERDQEVVLLLDCGHRMLTQDGDLSHFDHSLNAALLLAYVALRQGDAVGLATFGGEGRWLPATKGAAALHRVLNAIYDLQPTAQAPDYSRAALDLLVRQRKRALVIVVSNLRDEDAADLLPALQLLRRRHLVLFASLKEQALHDVLDADAADFEDALRVAATHDYLAYRDRTLDTVRASGVQCLDVVPGQLSVALVNRYLDIKRAGML